MALIDKASLLMVPSTYEQEKLYNVLPSGNRAPDSTDQNSGYDQTRADFTFDRGSNAAATRVNSDGLIEKYRENLLLQSNQFDTTWADNLGSGGSITSGQSGYDGTNNAWLISKSASFGRIDQTISSSGVQTYSVYAKANASDWVYFRADYSGGVVSGYFDLINGVGGSFGNQIDSKIESVGNGWYRIELAFNKTITIVRIYPAEENNQTAGTTGSIYIQNAQLETGLVATDYLDSGATTAKAGVLIDLPRINYDANGENGALLLEPSRLNAYLHSDYLYNFNGDETFNHATSPEGVNNATLLTKTSASDQFINMAWTGTTIAASSDYTMSIFVKHNGDDVNVRYEYNNSNDWGGVAWTALFEVRASGVTKSTAGNCTSDVEDYGNGWYRLKVFVTSGASITASSPANLFRVIGASGETLLVYGAQMEKGSYSTSLIPTYGTGGVTRAADSCSVTGVSDVIGQTEGVIFMDFVWDNSTASSADYPIMVYGSSTSNFVGLNTNTNTNQMLVYSGGSAVAAIGGGSFVVGQRYKIAMAYKVNDFAFYINGEQKGTDTAGAVPVGLANVRTESPFGGKKTGQKTKQITFFNERLSNSELATLTTL